MKKKYQLLILFASMICLSSYALKLPKFNNYPGGVVYFYLPSAANSPAPSAFYHHHRVLVAQHNHHWYAIMGLSIKAKPGNDFFKWKSTTDKQFHYKNFTIAGKQYPISKITIKKLSLVNPSKQQSSRIAKEAAKMNTALNQWTVNSPASLRLTLPVNGIFTTRFGAQRFINHQKKNIHSGLDIASPQGRVVHPALAGKVILVANFFITGNTLVIDHGQGLMTIYAHLNKIYVHQGQPVTANTKLAAVGSTGRVTGPHLHWGVSLNGIRVNPELFLSNQIVTHTN